MSLVALVVGGLLVGGFAVLGDGLVPMRAIDLMGNLAAPWVITAYLVGRRTQGPASGAVTGAMALVVGCVVYYVGNGVLRGVMWAWDPLLLMWFAVSVVVGPIVGACGGARSAGVAPVLRVALPAGAVLGEAVWFVIERRLWRADVVAEPHRLVDIALVALLVLLPVAVVTRDSEAGHGFVTGAAVVVAAAVAAIGLWGIRSILGG